MKKILVTTLITIFSIVALGQKSYSSRAGSLGIVSGIPNNPIGLSLVINIPNTDFGIYTDYKTGFGDEIKGRNYTGTISFYTADSVFGDRLIGEKTTGIIMLNFGLTYDITKRKSLYLYAGAGISMSNTYRQYYDSTRILDDSGYYLIEDTDKSFRGFNASVGAFYYILQYLAIQLGFDTNPQNVVVGITLGI